MDRFHTLQRRPGAGITVEGACLNGAFKIGQGRLTSSIPELRYRFDLLDLFANIVRLGEATPVADAVAPPVVADRFRVV